MEAVSSLELGGVIYPRCDTYGQGAGLAGGAGSGAALAPGQHVPPGEASAPRRTVLSYLGLPAHATRTPFAACLRQIINSS